MPRYRKYGAFTFIRVLHLFIFYDIIDMFDNLIQGAIGASPEKLGPNGYVESQVGD